MSKLKDALEAATPALERELSRIQDLIEAWGRDGTISPSTARDQLDRLKDGYENVTLMRNVSDALEFCEDNDDDISRVESQDDRYGTYFRAQAYRLSEYISGSNWGANELESRASDVQDSTSLSEERVTSFISVFLVSGPVPPSSALQRELRRALENESDYTRSPEQLLWDMAEGSAGGEDEDDTRLFCRFFDFKTTFDGFETGGVVPWPGDVDVYPWYIGGTFIDGEYDYDDPNNNFVSVALNQLGDLREEYRDAFRSGLGEDEEVELKEYIKQKARPIMDRVVDEAHEKYGAYRDSVIASVQKKRDEYDLSDDVVSAFSDYVKRTIGTLIKSVENVFSEETQFQGDGDWGVLRAY